jgi:hypothetical protein
MMEDNSQRSSDDSDAPDYAVKLITLITLMVPDDDISFGCC